MPSPRAKSNIVEIDFNAYLIKGATAKGKRVSNRVVRRVVEADGLEQPTQPIKNLPLPGLGDGEEKKEAEKKDIESVNSGENSGE